MTDDSPFKSPEIVDELHDSFDERSQEIFKLARGLRRLEFLFAFYFGGLAAPCGFLVEMNKHNPGEISSIMVFTILACGWTLASLITGIIVFTVLGSLGYHQRYLWFAAVASIPCVSIVGIVFAARLVQQDLRGYGLKFEWVGPSHKEILRQLRHHDGSPVDPKTLGMSRSEEVH
ncbi:hypothetical protein [Bremerella sp. P1]|uniref:hypothetical protein n=1 Tax=Bremerella sp. P1 TaxID=3026424 RepID=UPI002368262B|nr:hypothetical protein [Bremerella sp. P1]WDI44670.1 hypothetical protein PSR63_12060 [Bremerella sp. P1]